MKDTGIGVEPEQAKKLFKEAFARGEEAKKVHGFGRGIGVYVTGHIIRAHNGKIWAESPACRQAGKEKAKELLSLWNCQWGKEVFLFLKFVKFLKVC